MSEQLPVTQQTTLPLQSSRVRQRRRTADENIADQLTMSIKRKAKEHPEQPPAQLLRTEVKDVPDEVVSPLPLHLALVRAM